MSLGGGGGGSVGYRKPNQKTKVVEASDTSADPLAPAKDTSGKGGGGGKGGKIAGAGYDANPDYVPGTKLTPFEQNIQDVAYRNAGVPVPKQSGRTATTTKTVTATSYVDPVTGKTSKKPFVGAKVVTKPVKAPPKTKTSLTTTTLRV